MPELSKAMQLAQIEIESAIVADAIDWITKAKGVKPGKSLAAYRAGLEHGAGKMFIELQKRGLLSAGENNAQ